jgi:hypothetical protein
MKAEIVPCEDGRVIVSRIKPALGTAKTVCYSPAKEAEAAPCDLDLENESL